jgi:dipeptide/tripeptide permease
MHKHTHTINVNKTCALQQTTGKTGTKHSLCEIDINITNGVIFFTHHEQYYTDINVYGKRVMYHFVHIKIRDKLHQYNF